LLYKGVLSCVDLVCHGVAYRSPENNKNSMRITRQVLAMLSKYNDLFKVLT